MHLLNLTLQAGGAVCQSVYGNFCGGKSQDIVTHSGTALQLYQTNPSDPSNPPQLTCVESIDVFGVIRALIPFRLTGGTKDYLVCATDSGKITVLEYLPDANRWDIKHCETFGKTGCRRITPGQYIAVDPKGRAILIGAVEKQKLVYVMNRDASNRLTISSPLEAHRSTAIHFDMVGVDVGYENPIFAALELEYADADTDSSGQALEEATKTLIYYELDLGLNHVTRRWSETVPRSANKLIAVPGGSEGPGGVIVCSEGLLTYKNENHAEINCPIPRRAHASREVFVVASATHTQRDLFFVLIQSELGDLYKISFDYLNDTVTRMYVKFFDTIPVATSLCITKTGLLFASSEFSNHYLFQFQSIGEQDDTIEFHSEMFTDVNADTATVNTILQSTFPLRNLTNLILVDSLDSMSPITQLMVGDLANENNTYQMYTLTGQNHRSSLRILRHGLSLTEMATSPLPGIAKSIWCLKKSIADMYDSYIVVSFEDATLILEVGDTVEEVTESGFLTNTGSLLVGLLEDNSFIQVYTNGIRHIRQNTDFTNQPIIEWKAPGKKSIEKCTANQKQVIITLANGEIIYFELENSFLIEKGTYECQMEISCIHIGTIGNGSSTGTGSHMVRFPYVAVGSYDQTVRILSLHPHELFHQKNTLALTSHPHTVCISYLQTENSHAVGNGGTNENGSSNSSGSALNSRKELYLSIGLHNGVLHQSKMDMITATLSDARVRFLGIQPVKLVPMMMMHGASSILALSSRNWLSYYHQNKRFLSPLSCEPFLDGTAFHSAQCADGIVAISDDMLKIITIDKVGDMFNQQKLHLKYTPRQAVVHPVLKQLIVIESDCNRYLESELSALGITSTSSTKQVKPPNPEDDDDSMHEEEDDDDDENLNQFLIPKPHLPSVGDMKWSSCLRIVDPINVASVSCIDFDRNERALSVTHCVFNDRGGEVFIIVGTAVYPTAAPVTTNGSTPHHDTNDKPKGFIRVYRLVEGQELVLVHKTELDSGLPYALHGFQGRLLVSLGYIVRIYDLGKKKLLRKCEMKHMCQSLILHLDSIGNRIFASDQKHSFFYIKYEKNENQLVTFADDFVSRFITAQVVLDYDTICGGDKFGNVFVLRLPAEVSDQVENPTGNRILWDTGLLNGAPNKLEQIAQFYVGEVVTSMVRTRLVPAGMEAIIYTTIMGRIGALIPFTNREDVDFYTHLEMYMRQEASPLCGRDHLMYRSYFIPVKNIADGDLCEQFLRLPSEKQLKIANDLDRSPTEVMKKLEDIRNRLL